MKHKLGYKIYNNKIKSISSKNLFSSFREIIKYCDNNKYFKGNYSKLKNWESPDLHKKLIHIRSKDKGHFSKIYDIMQKNNSINEFCIENDLTSLAKKFLGIKSNNIMMRSQIRIDVPGDMRNTFDWHQDSAYDQLNATPSNGVVFWIPLLDAKIDKGALDIKPKSQCEKNIFTIKKKLKKFQSPQLTVPDIALQRYQTKKIPVKKNNILALYANLFHKSGLNISNKIRFTIVARFNKILTNDFYLFKK